MCGGEVIQSITQYRERARTNTTEFAEVVVWSNGRLVETVRSPRITVLRPFHRMVVLTNGSFHRMTILLNNISPNSYSEYDEMFLRSIG